MLLITLSALVLLIFNFTFFYLFHNFKIFYLGETDAVCKCITAGMFPNAAYLHRSGFYHTVRGDKEIHIHPSSTLYTLTQPQWYVMFCFYLKLSYFKDLLSFLSLQGWFYCLLIFLQLTIIGIHECLLMYQIVLIFVSSCSE